MAKLITIAWFLSSLFNPEKARSEERSAKTISSATWTPGRC
ncbi:hypothetical protein EV14_1841 [Prochlorococcus sp. MIT 0703]|nr:hypothetical protein EV12_2904 [Prochlorococcus sp. MIT 0701]KGG33000.1 hypothetical protein EV14_1841 [Prochlorococcus sp. MIT 0703]